MFAVEAAHLDPLSLFILPLPNCAMHRTDEQLQNTAQYVPIHHMINCISAVVLIESPDGTGTGTLVDGTSFGWPKYCVLTNKHVLESAEVAQHSKIVFNYEECPTPDYVRWELNPMAGFVCHKDTNLDYAVCACEQDGAEAAIV